MPGRNELEGAIRPIILLSAWEDPTSIVTVAVHLFCLWLLLGCHQFYFYPLYSLVTNADKNPLEKRLQVGKRRRVPLFSFSTLWSQPATMELRFRVVNCIPVGRFPV